MITTTPSRLAAARPQTRTALMALAASATLLALPGAAQAQMQSVTVTVQNLAPASGIAFAPLHFGFNQGSFDAFNLGGVATAPIISVAEGGSGNVWQAEFAAADPTATRGTIGGALTPGNSASLSFTVDPAINAFFTFASMVVPSNDLFIGNDSAIRLFDAAGNLLISSIDQLARQSWDNGSEVADPANTPANTAKLFVRDNGSGKTQLCVIFPTGAVQTIATEP